MKYKVGDKFLQEIEIRQIIDPLKYGKQYVVSGLQYANDADLDKLRRPDDMTVEEAWKIAKKLFVDLSNSELNQIFGKNWSYSKLMELSPQQAKAKIEAWEAERDIKVGDEVTDENGENCVVTNTSAMRITVIYKSGNTWNYQKDRLKKTGRNIDIQSVLEQIGWAE